MTINYYKTSVLIVLLTVGLTMHVFSQSYHEINSFVDQWHQAAARADAMTFFNSMADSSIYIGTDASERWTKSEFIAYAKPYFDKGKAWTFKPFNRDVHVSPDGQFAWFSELLETQMGPCRGSGVMQRNSTGWKILQYHLTLTVPNDLVDDFKKLVKAYESKVK